MDSAKEHALFNVTTCRWIYNEEKQRTVRYVPFNVHALVNVAIKAANAKECTSIEKIQDGTFNRVLCLKFDNDVELIAKIPFPVTGPKHYCTASEVATLDYLRTEHGISTPIVRAWCSRAESTPLVHFDNADIPLKDDPFFKVMPGVLKVEMRLYRTHFSQIGSIYYKEDVPESLRDRPLYAPWFEPYEPKSNSERFCIGPTVDREFWRAGRAALDIDRGPWPDVQSWMFALARCARASIANHPDKRFKEEYDRLISDYETLVPHIAPPNGRFILWHPDFYPRNIIVSDKPPHSLNGIIDWQSALVAFDYLQLSIPPAYDCDDHPYVVWPEDDHELPGLDAEVNSLDDEGKRKALVALRRAKRKKVHENVLRKKDPLLAEELHGIPGVEAKQRYFRPAVAITRGEAEGLVLIMYSFLQTRAIWPFIKGPDAPFPVEITDADVARIEKQWEEAARKVEMQERIMKECGVDPDNDGMVDTEKYDAVKRAFDDAKTRALAAAVSAEDRERILEEWRWQDGALSMTAELCC
ncbi:hypothetical protein NUW54_g4976 [Trametes sanguinea]|uniref:Uncharacterized protein n=1 Tax=Trametes sanguinea TaxID=158606 RepID=A0ACC1PY94_9APHY|nr:hypothetical protein NUW54_g4976 [Trametes sanguinea]